MTRSLDLAISDGRECERLRFESCVLWGGLASDGRECERMRFESCVRLGEGAAAMQKEGECWG
jgi:hypothetical protein